MELRRFNGELIGTGRSLREICVKNKANLFMANLSGADLSVADLPYANLSCSSLHNADLSGSNLYGANLSCSSLYNANLGNAILTRTILCWADLSGPKFQFPIFPSINLLSRMSLGALSDGLTLELMRRDAYGHPHPELFDEWAKGGDCPYDNEERPWLFKEKRELWRPGNPTMADRDLVKAICREKGWKIEGVEL